LPSVIVHGGAGAYEPGEAHERGLRTAVERAWSLLSAGGSSLDAVEAAIVAMEDDEVFNAGYGSSLTTAGTIECDASLMLSDQSCGAVAAIAAAKNPIRAARLVMETTDHVLLAGSGADEFAKRMGLPSADLRTERRVKLHGANMEKLRAGEDIKFLPRLAGLSEEMGIGTVGAVAIDTQGLIAAATSTGGMMTKLPGRVGDGAVVGAGTYANAFGGVSATGHGEPIMRHVLAKVAVDAIAETGVREAIESVLELGRVHGFGFGMIGADETGSVAYGFSTQAMSWAYRRDDEERTFLEE
jgi:beta-aspartyl-peptidase (threonine type)